MPKPTEKLLLLLADFITINCAFIFFTQIRSSLDLFVEQRIWFIVLLSLVVYGAWLLVFVFSGMYQSWYTQSRFDELIAVFKVVSLGVLLIFIVTFVICYVYSSPQQGMGRAAGLAVFVTMISVNNQQTCILRKP